VSDEVVSGLEQLGHERCVPLEVHPLDRRVGREAGPLDRDEFEPLGEGLLNDPRHSRAHHAAVNEDEPLHAAILRQVTK
jgi:hypothetical protein